MALRCEILVEGRIGSRLVDILDGFEVREVANGRSRLVGTLADRSALRGALGRLDDFGINMVSLTTSPDDDRTSPDVDDDR